MLTTSVQNQFPSWRNMMAKAQKIKTHELEDFSASNSTQQDITYIDLQC